ncbi:MULTISPECIES: DUF3189 family protein [unclassified Bacillus (in: firmicutes)]|uniref:DUF3189 family protein n=1 Tax=unclassified Bacillus (in: firmicutes) TaxID=185979 RepID=UPI000BEF647D|nr:MULTISPECIES: DUF3189 family protein [unclassified Bacillus (in: firmicutes)]PEJ56244.1 ABC transporter [Bacillus sp. AFS002410]PEL10545.1 ABC transporter [Bacillus sp. AFS017336]
MKYYIYYCFGGTHSSPLAAAYHLKQLPLDRQPTTEEVKNTYLFNKLKPKDGGKLFFHGEDENGDQVYTVAKRYTKNVPTAIETLGKILLNEDDKIILSSSSPTVPLAMTLGGFTSRFLHLDFIGVPLLVLGAKQTYLNLIKLVENTKRYNYLAAEKVTCLDNKNFNKD